MLTILLSCSCLTAVNVKADDVMNSDSGQFSQGYIKENGYSVYDDKYQDAVKPLRKSS